jgi:periplasmic protein TonB
MSTATSPSRLATPTDRDIRMALAIVASISFHGIVLSTQFTLVNPRLFENTSQPIDVVLVNAQTREAPLNAEALAQVNLAGGGNVDEDRQAKSPLPASQEESEASEQEALQNRVKQLEEQARQLLTQLKSETAVQTAPQTAPEPAPNASELMQQASEAAKLQARISQQWEEYQKRPRREFVGASAKSYTFARYVEDWVAKVERVGNLNYPEAARRQSIYGSLRLSVSIFADGRVEKIEIDKSSGSRILDQAAIRIVELAAPYAAFSKEMRDTADILSITRTWSFTRSDQLVGTD